MKTGMTRPRLIVVVVLGLLALAPAAGAASRTQIIRDCEDDSKLAGSYTTAELRDARNNLPSDKDAYSDCRDVLSAALAAAARARQAERAQSGGGGAAGAGGGGAGGAGAPDAGAPAPPPISIAPDAPPLSISPEEKRELERARTALPEVDVRGQKVVPGVGGVAGSAADASLPGTLIAVLVVLALTAALVAATVARRRVLGRRAA